MIKIYYPTTKLIIFFSLSIPYRNIITPMLPPALIRVSLPLSSLVPFLASPLPISIIHNYKKSKRFKYLIYLTVIGAEAPFPPYSTVSFATPTASPCKVTSMLPFSSVVKTELPTESS